MRKRFVLWGAPGLVLFVLLASGYVLEDRKAYSEHVITGTVVLFTQDELRVQTKTNTSLPIIYVFKLTDDTRYTGTVEQGSLVKVSYLREKLNRHVFRLVALTVEVIAAGQLSAPNPPAAIPY